MSSLFHSFTEGLASTSNIAVAFSGGVDSTVLLHLANEFRKRKPSVDLFAIHVNHQLSDNSEAWALHCAKICEKMNIPFECFTVDIQDFLHLGTEGAARKARYEALASLSPSGASILLGQHQEDQAETFLLQVARGAGPKGLSAMGLRHKFSSRTFIRPLLNTSQTNIIQYAKQHDLHWIEDESNQNTDFDRNYIRNEVLPLVQRRWPSFSRSAAKSAKMCASEMFVIKEYMDVLSKDLLGNSKELLLDSLQAHSAHTQRSFLRYWLEMHNILMPSEKVLQEILNMQLAKDDACPAVSLGTAKVRRYMRALYVDGDDEKEILQIAIRLLLDDGDTDGKYTFQATDISSIKIEFGKLTERFKPYANRPTKKIKEWCKEWKIPPWQRHKIALIYADNILVGIVDDTGNIVLSLENSTDKAKSTFIIEQGLAWSPKNAK